MLTLKLTRVMALVQIENSAHVVLLVAAARSRPFGSSLGGLNFGGRSCLLINSEWLK